MMNFIEYTTFKKELECTISVMNRNIKINVIKEIINSLDELEDTTVYSISDSKNVSNIIENLEMKNL